nr:BMP-2-inducible protein kinase-like [Aedes albopictus]XP_029730057.1 BMP-2-inducible protein kinase-like [Aedes albopictus]XP_029730063.1 BMP-2-inducible protein kinase-like [Aedes albopictus]XP_029730067.1 BMP-2-inducible protein kinase-like [Aedes albopictus]XP_029730072.1 BMP-2-inducible protein kinase-like [Aedes albopictus]XP_029730078.1 BMP-2-inducible protein kinase-like [Aedes albopictus]XP_029730082.1 BMP-2-inducible protein kinase-like [Aedes albopictus]XP_029730084.1 BMP-2-indu
MMPSSSSSGYVASLNALDMFDKSGTPPFPSVAATTSSLSSVPSSPPRLAVPSIMGFPFDALNVSSSSVAIASPSQTPTLVTTSSTVGTSAGTEDFVVLPGPEDVLLFNSSNGLYQQSVTLTARMYPIEATAAKSIWGLPTLIWGILIGTIVILIVILATLFFCCWLQPRTRKLLSSSYYTGSSVSHNSIVPKSQTSDSNQLVMPLSIGICPPQYSAPPPPTSNSGSSNSNQHQQNCTAVTSTGIPCHPAGGSAGNTAGHHGKYGSSPQQYSHAYHQQQQQQQQQYQHHHQCIHHQQQQQQQQQQQYHAHYAQLQHQQSSQYAHQQQTLQQYYNQQQQQHQQQQQQQQQQQHQHQQITQYIHPTQQQALQQQQQREHQIQQHHFHHQQQHHHQQQQQQQHQGQLVHHKSMWAINPLYASSGVINDSSTGGGGDGTDEDCGSTSYRTRSLPSWGKNKQRPLSNADDLEELYAKVNFSKKRRNRMRNDEAAIIALCRSRSQNLSALPMADQDAVVVYDERTAL